MIKQRIVRHYDYFLSNTMMLTALAISIVLIVPAYVIHWIAASVHWLYHAAQEIIEPYGGDHD